MKMNFEGKIILITGAAGGIGSETARVLSSLGGQCVLVDCNSKRLDVVVNEIVTKGHHIPLKIVADVTVAEDIDHIIDKTIEKFEKLDVLINNVGVITLQSLMNLQMHDYDRIMSVNVRSAVVMSRCAVPWLEKTKGNIINVSSITGTRARPERLAYSMSKSALNQFTKCIAVELGPKSIRVNAVTPSAINTELTVTPSARMEYLTNSYPLRRIGEASDVANCIAFLASDAASFVTGNIFGCDGGALAANII